jgi:hypothetical protein
MFLAASLFYGSLSSLTIMLEDSEKKACPAKTFAAPNLSLSRASAWA